MGPWLAFVWTAIVVAGTVGFGYGAAAFAAFAAGLPIGPWWPAAVQAHGHLQLFGWAGLMVLGVGFFFLPRLRGTRLAIPSLLPWILGLVAGGLVLRAIAQPALALAGGLPLRAGLAASGILEIAGASLAVGVLAATGPTGPPLRQRTGLLPVLPYLATAFAALWLALAANAALVVSAAFAGTAVAAAQGDAMVDHLGLVGFLVPISVAVTARTFPLYLWLRLASPAALKLALLPFLSGLALRSAGILGNAPALSSLGALLEGASFIAFAALLNVVPLRRRQGEPPSHDAHYVKPVEWLLIPAYLWLALAGLADLVSAPALFGLPLPISSDVERHALGSGFITLLILGMGARMLPGFTGRVVASTKLVWATVWLGNAGALLRVVPVALASAGGADVWPFGPASATLAISGALSMAAVLCFGANLWKTFTRAGRTPASGPRSAAPRTGERPR